MTLRCWSLNQGLIRLRRLAGYIECYAVGTKRALRSLNGRRKRVDANPFISFDLAFTLRGKQANETAAAASSSFVTR